MPKTFIAPLAISVGTELVPFIVLVAEEAPVSYKKLIEFNTLASNIIFSEVMLYPLPKPNEILPRLSIVIAGVSPNNGVVVEESTTVEVARLSVELESRISGVPEASVVVLIARLEL